MSITCDDLIQYATELSQTGSSEIVYRTSISRAYYSAYLYALEFCEEKGLSKEDSTSNDGVHGQLIKALKNAQGCDPETRRKAKNLGQKLQLARAERVCADYHTKLDIDQKRALAQIATVRRILKIN